MLMIIYPNETIEQKESKMNTIRSSIRNGVNFQEGKSTVIIYEGILMAKTTVDKATKICQALGIGHKIIYEQTTIFDHVRI